MQDKRSKIEHIRALNSKLNMRAVLEYYTIEYDDQGRGRFKVKCPFHNDNHPSLQIFTDNESGQDSWWCPVCNDNGDCFRFIQSMTHSHTKSLATANEIIKGLGSDIMVVDPKYREAMEKQRLRKKVYLLDYKLGVRYRDWLISLKEHPKYGEACKRVDEIFEQLDNLVGEDRLQAAIDFIKEKASKLKGVRK
jgi:DNA primase